MTQPYETSAIDTATINDLVRRVVELEERLQEHTGDAQGSAGQFYPHPVQMIDTAEFGGGVEQLNRNGIVMQMGSTSAAGTALRFDKHLPATSGEPATSFTSWTPSATQMYAELYGGLVRSSIEPGENTGIKLAHSTSEARTFLFADFNDNDAVSQAQIGVYEDSALTQHAYIVINGNTYDIPLTSGGMTPPLFGFPFNPAALVNTGSYADITISGSTTYSSVDDAIKIATNFTINSGQTLTAKAKGVLIVCKKFTSAGTIDARGGNGSGSTAGTGGAGGDGGAGGTATGTGGTGGVGTSTPTLSLMTGPSSTVTAFLAALASGAYDTAVGIGVGGSGASGGGNSSGAFGGNGGNGGDGSIATKGSATGTTGANGAAAYSAGGNMFALAAAAVLMHIRGTGGGGGGGGGGNNGTGTGGVGGGGGEGGSSVTIICDEFDNTGGSILTSGGQGGNGANAVGDGVGGCGGGGGGAGSIIVVCRKLTAQGTLTANGGAAGTFGTGTTNGKAGGVGGAGKIIVIGAS